MLATVEGITIPRVINRGTASAITGSSNESRLKALILNQGLSPHEALKILVPKGSPQSLRRWAERAKQPGGLIENLIAQRQNDTQLFGPGEMVELGPGKNNSLGIKLLSAFLDECKDKKPAGVEIITSDIHESDAILTGINESTIHYESDKFGGIWLPHLINIDNKNVTILRTDEIDKADFIQPPQVGETFTLGPNTDRFTLERLKRFHWAAFCNRVQVAERPNTNGYRFMPIRGINPTSFELLDHDKSGNDFSFRPAWFPIREPLSDRTHTYTLTRIQ